MITNDSVERHILRHKIAKEAAADMEKIGAVKTLNAELFEVLIESAMTKYVFSISHERKGE